MPDREAIRAIIERNREALDVLAEFSSKDWRDIDAVREAFAAQDRGEEVDRERVIDEHIVEGPDAD